MKCEYSLINGKNQSSVLTVNPCLKIIPLISFPCMTFSPWSTLYILAIKTFLFSGVPLQFLYPWHSLQRSFSLSSSRRCRRLCWHFIGLPGQCSRILFSASLKGQCHEIFHFWFYSWISFPPAPEYLLRTVSNFFRKFLVIFASQGASPVSTTPAANFATSFAGVVDTGGK